MLYYINRYTDHNRQVLIWQVCRPALIPLYLAACQPPHLHHLHQPKQQQMTESRISQCLKKKLCKIVFARTSSNFYQF